MFSYNSFSVLMPILLCINLITETMTIETRPEYRVTSLHRIDQRSHPGCLQCQPGPRSCPPPEWHSVIPLHPKQHPQPLHAGIRESDRIHTRRCWEIATHHACPRRHPRIPVRIPSERDVVHVWLGGRSRPRHQHRGEDDTWIHESGPRKPIRPKSVTKRNH